MLVNLKQFLVIVVEIFVKKAFVSKINNNAKTIVFSEKLPIVLLLLINK